MSFPWYEFCYPPFFLSTRFLLLIVILSWNKFKKNIKFTFPIIRSHKKNLNLNRDSNLSSNFSLETWSCKFPKAQIISLFLLNNLIWITFPMYPNLFYSRHDGKRHNLHQGCELEDESSLHCPHERVEAVEHCWAKESAHVLNNCHKGIHLAWKFNTAALFSLVLASSVDITKIALQIGWILPIGNGKSREIEQTHCKRK